MDLLDMTLTFNDQSVLNYYVSTLGMGYWFIKMAVVIAILAWPLLKLYKWYMSPYLVPVTIIGPNHTLSYGEDRGRIYKDKATGKLFFKLLKRNFNVEWVPSQQNILPPRGVRFCKGVIPVVQKGISEFSFLPLKFTLTTKDDLTITDAENNLALEAAAIQMADYKYGEQPSALEKWMPLITVGLPIVALVIVLVVFSNDFTNISSQMAEASVKMAEVYKASQTCLGTGASQAAQVPPASPVWGGL